jgi:hypothetical protein
MNEIFGSIYMLKNEWSEKEPFDHFWVKKQQC